MIVSTPNRTWQAGVFNIPATAVPLGVERMEVRVDRTSWSNTAISLKIEIERSFDNGATWTPAGGSTILGGDIVDRDGNPVTESVLTTIWKRPDLSTRMVRGTFTLSASLRTQVTIEIV